MPHLRVPQPQVQVRWVGRCARRKGRIPVSHILHTTIIPVPALERPLALTKMPPDYWVPPTSTFEFEQPLKHFPLARRRDAYKRY